MSRVPSSPPLNVHEPAAPAESQSLRVSAAAPLSFDALFRRYASRVATVGMRIMGRTHDLEDFVQDVFLEVHRGLHRLQSAEAAPFWIDRIAVRRAVRRVRSTHWKRLVGFDDAPSGLEIEDAGASPETRVLVHQLLGRLQHFPPRARACWLLRKVDGYELRETAEAVGCSLATAKRDIARVDAALRREQMR